MVSCCGCVGFQGEWLLVLVKVVVIVVVMNEWVQSLMTYQAHSSWWLVVMVVSVRTVVKVASGAVAVLPLAETMIRASPLN